MTDSSRGTRDVCAALRMLVPLLSGVVLLTATPPAVTAQQGSAAALSQPQPVRDATQEQRIKSLQEEAARDVYATTRSFTSRWMGLAVFFVFCLLLIFFLDRKIRQRDHLRRIGYFDQP